MIIIAIFISMEKFPKYFNSLEPRVLKKPQHKNRLLIKNEYLSEYEIFFIIIQNYLLFINSE